MASDASNELVKALSSKQTLAGTEVFVFTQTGIDGLVDLIVYGCLREVFIDSGDDEFETTQKIRERIKQKYGVK